MLYYLTSTGNGCSPDDTLPSYAVACTQAQYENAGAWTVREGVIVAASPPEIDSRIGAQTALDRSDMTALRCFKAGVAFPSDWKAYVIALRAIVAGEPTSIALPTQPAFPAGT